MGRRSRPPLAESAEFASLLLDASAVLAVVQDRPEVQRWIQRASKAGIGARVSLVTVAEVFRDRPAGARVQWVLSRLDKEPVTLQHAWDAGRLLGAAGGDGTIDALVAATALRMPRPVVVLTSDAKDLDRLLEGQSRVVVAKV